MQAVLSIDATTEPAIVSVIRLDGANLEVVETHRISLERGLVPSTATQAALNPSLAAQGRPQSGVTTDSETTPTTIAPLDLTSMVTSRWNSAVVIIPGEQYHSLNVNLPFNDPRKVNKRVPLWRPQVAKWSVCSGPTSELLRGHPCLVRSTEGRRNRAPRQSR